MTFYWLDGAIGQCMPATKDAPGCSDEGQGGYAADAQFRRNGTNVFSMFCDSILCVIRICQHTIVIAEYFIILV